MSSPIYTARVVEEIDNGKGYWKYLKIGVFRKEGDKEEQVGEYKRNYSNLYNTFFPFHLNGKDLALYSKDYTCTRIMELPSCKDIGGEEPHGHGFCPVDFYVPSYADYEMIHDYRAGQKVEPYVGKYRVDEPGPGDLKAQTEWSESKSRRITGRMYYPFGFVAGCIWGDDTSWKIEYLDLDRAHEGILVRSDRFGYIELPANLDLKKAIHIDGDPDGDPMIRIATESYYDFKTGKRSE